MFFCSVRYDETHFICQTIVVSGFQNHVLAITLTSPVMGFTEAGVSISTHACRRIGQEPDQRPALHEGCSL